MTDKPAKLDLAGIRARAEAAKACAQGPWTTEDVNVDDLQRPTRFAGPVVIYADEGCETHPIADCSCNHTCRDEDRQRDVAAHIAGMDPLTTLALVDEVERLKRKLLDSRETEAASRAYEKCSHDMLHHHARRRWEEKARADAAEAEAAKLRARVAELEAKHCVD